MLPCPGTLLLKGFPIVPEWLSPWLLCRRRATYATSLADRVTAKLTGQMAGQGGQSSQTAQYRPYRDVPFEDLVALVDKLDRLKEANVVVAEGKVIDS